MTLLADHTRSRGLAEIATHSSYDAIMHISNAHKVGTDRVCLQQLIAMVA